MCWTMLFLGNVYNLDCCVNVYVFLYIDIPVANQLSKDANLENKINFAIFLWVFLSSFFLLTVVCFYCNSNWWTICERGPHKTT